MAVPGPEGLIGQTVKGWLKRFQDGWGFMNSDAFQGDLFVHARENPDIVKYPVANTEFYFQVAMNHRDPRGKPMATNCTPANPTQQVAPPPASINTGERYEGLMRTFADHWGFIRTDNGQDYYFHEKSVETFGGELPTVGSRVEFSTAPDNQKPDKVMAVNLKTLVPGTGGTGMGPQGNSMPNKRSAGGAGMVPQMQMPGMVTMEQIEAQALSFLPSARLFQLAEARMRQESGMMAGMGDMSGMAAMGMGMGGMPGMAGDMTAMYAAAAAAAAAGAGTTG
jgi:cold shock CspA family protein